MRKAFLAGAALVWAHAAEAQQPAVLNTTALTAAQRAALRVESVKISPEQIQLTVGDTVPLQATAYNASGNPVPGVRIRCRAGCRSLRTAGTPSCRVRARARNRGR